MSQEKNSIIPAGNEEYPPEVRERLQQIYEAVEEFPRSSGVYLMRGEGDVVLYIGKAKDLRSRVKSYFKGGDGRVQIQFLMRRVLHVDKIITASEYQALVLERDLITQYKPKYNIKLKDDKAYISIRIDTQATWPRLELVRKRHDDGARYFGPYTFSHELKTMLEIIKKTIPLRTCSDTVMFNRQRPCLEYQIKRCAGPCCIPVEAREYRRWLNQAIQILEGKTASVIKELTAQMDRAAEELRFEDAATLRDRITTLEHCADSAALTSSRGETRDVLALWREERLVAAVILTIRGGRIADTKAYTLSGVEVSDDEVTESIILQHYDKGRIIPEEIVLQVELENRTMIEEALTERAGSRVSLLVPQRGSAKKMLEIAEMNVREHFISSFDTGSRYQELSRRLALQFNLRQAPRRVECVDISNFQGGDTVGAVVCFVDGMPERSLYKRYSISHQSTPDDFASIQEVVGRRLERGQAEDDIPDLLIIDGGAGQLAMALEARDALNVSVDIVALAKERTKSDVRSSEIVRSQERVFLAEGGEPILLDPQDELTHFMQRVRDEVHRYVITFHRSVRGRRLLSSQLDAIGGVGTERKMRLLKAFGSIEGIKRASVEEIAKQGKMPQAIAQKVLEVLAGEE
jgi:excinuclease ABC subunit C